MEDKRVRGILYVLGALAFVFIVSQSTLDASPAQILLFVVFIGLPVGFVVLVIRALIRVGDKRPPPVQFVAPHSGLGPGWYPDQQSPGLIRWYDGHAMDVTRAASEHTSPTAELLKDATMNPQPGWYPDPQNNALQRYWNGTMWSDATRRGSGLTSPQPQGMPQKKPMSTGVKLLIVGLLIMGSGIVISAVSGNDNSTSTATRITTTARAPYVAVDKVSPETRAATTTKQAPIATGLGTEIRDGKFAFVVTNVESGLTNIGKKSSWFNETAEGQFVIVSIDVTNTSTKPQFYSSSNQLLIDLQGREFTNDSSAELGLEGDNRGVGDLNPGITRSTRLVFDIPIDAVPAALEAHDSMFSTGARVKFK
ncbi:DUF4352 domain-containing protein [Rhodococcus sp. IEGM 1379]|uniref:DUF4352 domain-containing protein n=1 Tax=Rhodococcus sp. IEGM 1379 TaxID=3047086 RepID=UPI0024B6D6B4|nr:DUF4352 domain-containing protein [Rhodococcus sp. IEGM 1379]MDI9914336.1 DUF4352 domain-containing protein [Rhodococcus sp. IEGM 1379]